ncbi:MAG: hypothetical protein ACE5EU_09800 [Paracoccaceae bacterium]
MTGNGKDAKPKSDTGTSDDAHEKMIEAAEETMHEMRDAMNAMMSASTKMMQSFIDMRLSYLKVMRAGLEDPMATAEMMSENLKDIAKAVNRDTRTKE